MTEQSKELAYVPAKEKAMAVFTTDGALDPYLSHVRAEIDAFKPDLTTKKGRDAIASMAYKVSQSKSALETLGKALADEAKDIPKKIDASRKKMKETLDAWRDEVRKPLDDWEAEQKRLEEIRLAEIAAKELQDQVDRDHELAVLMYAEHLRQKEEAAKQAVIDADNAAKAQKERDEQIAKEAAERATREANEAAGKAILDAKLAAETAQREKAESEAREKQAVIDAQARELEQKQAAELATKQAAEKAERDRLQAIADTEARIASEKAAADALAAKQAANKANQKRKNNEALDDLVELGCSKELAQLIVVALAKQNIRNCSINY